MITNISARMAGITRMARMDEEEEKNIYMDAQDMQDYLGNNQAVRR